MIGLPFGEKTMTIC